MKLGRFSFGIGDRFGRQGRAQLAAIEQAQAAGANVTPVWNKSHREHSIVHTTPDDVRREAEHAVRDRDFQGPYFVDADHINLANVDHFLAACDFFTLDVADFIGRPPADADLRIFLRRNEHRLGLLEIPGIDRELIIGRERLHEIGEVFLAAVQQAAAIYRRIADAKGPGSFVTEVSMDETDRAQSPIELYFILEALASEGVPAQTIAPRFSGRFNKGVDYVGDPADFEREFREDLAVCQAAVAEFGLPADLKLSVHSGSDKFSLYQPIRRTLDETNAGVHIKTAGTTWLEEIIGLAQAGGQGLLVAQDIYDLACLRRQELCKPYAAVIDIHPERLPDPAQVRSWDGHRFARALRHDPDCPDYNPDLRQLLHVAYKLAAELGPRYLDALDACEEHVARNVRDNLYHRHLARLFVPAQPNPA